MHPIEQELFGLAAQLSPRARVALAARAIEHVLPLYRTGPAKLLAHADLISSAGVQPQDDLIDRGLDMLWRYVRDGSHDAVAVQTVSDAIAAGLSAAPRDKATKAGLGAGLGLTNALNSVLGKNEIDNALARVVLGIFHAFTLLVKDDDMPAREKRNENVWQQKVARRLLQLGDKPIEREAFEDLLAEKLAWHDLLPQYAERVLKQR
jgi:hypothetical protein